MSKDISLLLGNGINQLEVSTGSWKDVLSALAHFAGRPQIMDGADYKPFTLIYEEVIAALAGPDLEKLETSVKTRVAQAVHKIPRNSYHEHFENLGFRHILTTNYDYNIGANAKPANLQPESKYSLFRRRTMNDQSIWMIHGEIRKPNTIMLGHEQYAGALQKIRSYVTSKDKGKDGYYSPFRAGNYDFDNTGQIYSWVDVFFRDDVHILGFSLDYTEIELWWLLAYKARLKRKSSLQTGTTYYYLFSKNRKDPRIQSKVALMESLEVKVYLREVKNSQFRPHYDWALDRLSKFKK